MKTYYSATTTIRDDKASIYLSSEVIADSKPKDTRVELRDRTIYVDWFDSVEAARTFISEQI
ncbi:MAG: hypothetical protein R3Y50_05940 [Rikenellaceae bacterium]